MIKVNEALLVTYTVPSPITKTTEITDRELVVYAVMPKKLQNKLNQINSRFNSRIRKCLRSLGTSKLFFLKYPLEKHKERFDSIRSKFDKEYEDFAGEVNKQIGQIKKDAKTFCKKYKLAEKSIDYLNLPYLRTRFKPRFFLYPIKFDISAFDFLSKKERRKIGKEIQENIETSYRQILNERMAEFFRVLSDQTMKEDMIRAQTLKKLESISNDLEFALNVVEDERFMPVFNLLLEMVSDLSGLHDEYKGAKTKQMKEDVTKEKVTTVKKIAKEAKPMVNKIKSFVLKEIDQKSLKTSKDEALKKLLEELKL